ncbi:MAG: hypothetical protein AB7K86_05080 [Rhodospirillales bacterium]
MILSTAGRCVAALLLLLAAAGTARALTINDMFDNYVAEEVGSALYLAMTTEAYRHMLAGREAQAHCISQNLVIRRDKAGKEIVPKPFAQLLEALNGLRERDDRYVEDYVLGAVKQFCEKAPALKRNQKPAVARLPVSSFFMLPTDKERSVMLTFATSTQAFRMQVTGERARGDCVIEKLLPQKDAQGRMVEPAGLRQLAAQLAANRTSRDQSVESYVWGSINHHCPAS